MTRNVIVVLVIGKMGRELDEKVENILSRIKPSLGGADVRLKDISEGVVTLEYHRPLSNPSACHVDRTPITKEIVIETLEDHLKKVIPGFKKVVLLGEE
jgi:hypothetical protein